MDQVLRATDRDVGQRRSQLHLDAKAGTHLHAPDTTLVKQESSQ